MTTNCLIFDVLSAQLVTGGQTLTVDLAALAAARPDCLAAMEAKLLCHLTDNHKHVIELLTRMTPPDRRHDVRAARPVRQNVRANGAALCGAGRPGLVSHTPAQ